MCPRKPDREASELLQQLQHLQAREPIPDIEPPTLIDQAVRNMARRELTRQSPPVAGKLGWIAGLSTASIALIALGISLVQTPSAPAPVNERSESFESRKPELHSSDEWSELTAPAAPQMSRSAQVPMADAADSAAAGEAERMAADTAYKDSFAAEVSQSGDGDFPSSREDSAQAWLSLIEELNQQGLQSEAVEQLSAWQTQYPDLLLPGWAKALLEIQP